MSLRQEISELEASLPPTWSTERVPVRATQSNPVLKKKKNKRKKKNANFLRILGYMEGAVACQWLIVTLSSNSFNSLSLGTVEMRGSILKKKKTLYVIMLFSSFPARSEFPLFISGFYFWVMCARLLVISVNCKLIKNPLFWLGYSS